MMNYERVSDENNWQMYCETVVDYPAEINSVRKDENVDGHQYIWPDKKLGPRILRIRSTISTCRESVVASMSEGFLSVTLAKKAPPRPDFSKRSSIIIFRFKDGSVIDGMDAESIREVLMRLTVPTLGHILKSSLDEIQVKYGVRRVPRAPRYGEDWTYEVKKTMFFRFPSIIAASPMTLSWFLSNIRKTLRLHSGAHSAKSTKEVRDAILKTDNYEGIMEIIKGLNCQQRDPLNFDRWSEADYVHLTDLFPVDFFEFVTRYHTDKVLDHRLWEIYEIVSGWKSGAYYLYNKYLKKDFVEYLKEVHGENKERAEMIAHKAKMEKEPWWLKEGY